MVQQVNSRQAGVIRDLIKKLAQADTKKDRKRIEAELLRLVGDVLEEHRTPANLAIIRLLSSIKPSRIFTERKYFIAYPKEFESAIDELIQIFGEVEEVKL